MEPPAMGTPGGSSSPAFPPNYTISAAALPSSSSNSSSPSTSYSLCEGLDLLAMAALEAAGVDKKEKESNINQDNSGDAGNDKPARKGEGEIGGVVFGPVPKRKRQSLMPFRYQDSVLQPWKPRSRRRRVPAATRRLG